jgi:hypothetical protein
MFSNASRCTSGGEGGHISTYMILFTFLVSSIHYCFTYKLTRTSNNLLKNIPELLQGLVLFKEIRMYTHRYINACSQKERKEEYGPPMHNKNA